MDATHLSQPDSSLYFSKVIQELSKDVYPAAYAKALKGEARCLIVSGRLTQATKLLSEARTIFVRQNDFKSIAETEHFLAILFTKIKNYPKAAEHFHKALQMGMKTKDSAFVYKDLSNLVLVNCKMGNTKQAAKFLDLQEKYLPDNNLDPFYLYNNYYSYYTLIGDYDKAFDYSLRSLQTAREAGMDDAYISALINHSKVLTHTNRKKEARTCLLNALNLARKSGNLPESVSILELLHQDASQSNNHQLALEYLIELKKVSDRLNLRESNFQIQNSENQIRLSENEELIAKQKNAILRAELKEEKYSRQVFIYASLALLIGLICLIIFLFYFQARKTNRIMAEQKKEVTMQREKLKELHELNQKVFAIVSHDFSSPLTSLDVLLSLMQKNGSNPLLMDQLLPDVKSQLDQARMVLNNLLQFAKSELQAEQLSSSKTQIIQVIDRVLNEFSQVIEQKNLQLSVEIPADAVVRITDSLLLIASRNLISNAIKYSYEKGRIHIFLSDQGQLVFKDEGIGLSDELKGRLFREHVSSTQGTALENGFGLGLKISSELLLKEGAWIEFSDKNSIGSEFVLNFRP